MTNRRGWNEREVNMEKLKIIVNAEIDNKEDAIILKKHLCEAFTKFKRSIRRLRREYTYAWEIKVEQTQTQPQNSETNLPQHFEFQKYSIESGKEFVFQYKPRKIGRQKPCQSNTEEQKQ